MVYDGSGGRPPRRRHWPEAEKRRMVGEVGVDGHSVADVARRHGLHSSVLGRWCARFGDASVSPSPATPTFLPVTVASPEAVVPARPPKADGGGNDAVIEVILANGRRLVAGEAIIPSRLRLLIAAIEAA